MKQQDYKTAVKKAKNLGPGKTGAGHWWSQRVTAIFLIPVIIWFIATILQLGAISEYWQVKFILKKDYNILGLIVLTSLMLYHGYLGMQVITEDYIKCEMLRTGLILAAQFACLVTFIAAIMAILKLYIY